MQKSTLSFSLTHYNLTAVLWGVLALMGAAALVALLRTPSEPASAVLFGYSLIRLLTAGAALLAMMMMAVFSTSALAQPGWWQKLARFARQFHSTPNQLFGSISVLFGLFLAVLAILLIGISEAGLAIRGLRPVIERLGVLLVWFEFVIIGLGCLAVLQSPPDTRRGLITPLRLAILVTIFTLIYTVAVRVYGTTLYLFRLRDLQDFIFYPAGILLARGIAHQWYGKRPWYERLNLVLLTLFTGAFAYLMYRHTAQLMEWYQTPSKAYWNDLADAFLHGRLYLINPESTHDMTFYNGQWYVPNPPLPAFIVMPFVALIGLENLNMVYFSIACGAINVMLIFLLLERASHLEMIPTTRTGNLWLTAVFAIGTTHWWLSLMGRMWFTSQLLTLMFSALALMAVLYRRSPWWVGLGLGLAILSRPNVFTLWPFLVGVALYLEQRERGTLPWKRMVAWAVQSAVPVVLAVMGLLYYNFIRFGSWFDFGYVTINSAEWLTNAVRTYGMFNSHFLPINIDAMFFKMPTLMYKQNCLYFSPTREGISMFAMTPAIIYMFRRLTLNWWTAGAWVSIILSAGLLLFYHNTGAWQLGYRYLLDFILPVLLLMGIGVGRKVSWVFAGLTLLSIAGNLAGMLWWFDKWFCYLN